MDPAVKPREFELLTEGFEPLTESFELLTEGFKLLAESFELLDVGYGRCLYEHIGLIYQ
jgi:hypothetical protein